GFFLQAEDGIRDGHVTGVQTCALPISSSTIISPTFSSGAKIADRVPTTTRASPIRTRHHSRARSASLIAECNTATPSKRAPNHEIGRASCRERVKIWLVAGTYKKKDM